jgi:trimeric autotransporter adhesin
MILMKRLKICTIVAAIAVASSLYTAPTFAAEASNNINLDLASVESNVSTNSVKATFKVTNNGDSAINLSDVKLRYYYTADNNKEQEFHCYNADIPTPYRSVTGNVSGKFVTMEKAMDGADTYLEIGFDSSAGTLEQGQTVSVQSNFNKKDWSNYNQANDYSFDNADKTVVLVGGTVVKGTAPSKEIVVNPEDQNAPVVNKDAKVEVSVSNGTSDNSVAPKFTVTNTSGADLDLTTLKLKYYYTADGDEAQTFNCYYAGTVGGTYQNLTGNVVGKTNKLDTATADADSYVQVTFNGGTLVAGQSMEVQASVNKDGWKNYNQSNDYSYNTGNKVTAAVNDKVIWGTAPVEGPVVPNSKLSINSVDVDKENLSDIVIDMELNGNVFDGIEGLTKGTNYTVDGTKVTISKDYIAGLSAGIKNLTFKFDKGDTQTLKVNVVESKHDSLITPINVDYDVNNKLDVKIEMTLNGNALVDIKNGDVALKESTDYIVNGNTVTLKQAYLDTLKVGQSVKLTFDFSKGNSQTLTVNVNGVHEGLVLTLPDVTAKAGEVITIPLTITGITADGLNGCNFKIKYDPELFENVTITPGDILVNPNKTLFKIVDKSTGVISVMYADSTGKDAEAIVKDGLFMNINLKVKDTVKNATSKIEVTKPGTFVDKESNKYEVRYKIGTITIGDTPIIVDPTISAAAEKFEITNPLDIKVGVLLNGSQLSEIKIGDKVLVKDKDYAFDGTTVTLSKDCLLTLPVGSSDFVFKFSNEKEAKLTVAVTQGPVVPTDMSAGIGQIEAKPGDTITLPIKLTGVPTSGIANFAYRIKYDPSVVEVVGVEAGSAITNPQVNFVSDIYPDKKIISILFIDNAMNDEETIKTAGGLANIKFKIKDTAPKGLMNIEFNNDDHSFYDINGNEIKLSFADGSINVK